MTQGTDSKETLWLQDMETTPSTTDIQNRCVQSHPRS